MVSSCKCSNYNEFYEFVKKERINRKESFKQSFIDVYNGNGYPFAEGTLGGIADLASKMSINNVWKSIKKENEEFYKNNGYIEIEYDDETGSIMAKKRVKGRPVSKNRKSKIIQLRLTDDEIEKIDNYCNTNNVTRSEILRSALNTFLK